MVEERTANGQIPNTETPLPARVTILSSVRGRIRWSLPGNSDEANLKLGISNIQALFLEGFPDFDQRFPREEDGKIPEDRKADAKRFVLEALGSNDKIIRVAGSSPRNSHHAPYFHGSHRTIISRSFSPWGIDFPEFNDQEAHLPIVEKKGVYVDDNKQVWIQGKVLSKSFGVHEDTIRRNLTDIPTLLAKNKGGRPVVLYNQQEADKVLSEKYEEELGNLPQVGQDGFRYVDKEGNSWIIASFYLKPRFDISWSGLKYLLKDVNSRRGRDRLGRPTVFYLESAVTEHAASFTNLPKVDKKSGIYVDESGESWATGYAIARKYGYHQGSLFKFLKGLDLRTRLGRGINGIRVVLYNEVEALEKYQSFLSLPQVDKETGAYTNNEGQDWTTIGFLAQQSGLSYQFLHKLLKDVPQIQGREKNGRAANLLNKEVATKLIGEIQLLPVVDKETHVYTDEEGDSWGSLTFLMQELDIDSQTLLPYLRRLSFKTGRVKTRSRTRLYKISAVKNVLEKNRFFTRRRERLTVDNPTDNISTNEANEQLRRLLEEE